MQLKGAWITRSDPVSANRGKRAGPVSHFIRPERRPAIACSRFVHICPVHSPVEHQVRYSGSRRPLRQRASEMPRKASTRQTATDDNDALGLAEAKVAETRENVKKPAKKGTGSLDDLARTALRAFLIARDAAFNIRDLLTLNSRMAFLAIK